MAFRSINIVGQVLPPVTVSIGSVSLLLPVVTFVFPLVLSKFQIEMCHLTCLEDVLEGLKHGFQIGAFASSAALYKYAV